MRATLRRRLHELYAEIATGSIVHACRQRDAPSLHWAIYYNRPRVAELLLDAGADIGTAGSGPGREATRVRHRLCAKADHPRAGGPWGTCKERTRTALKGVGGAFEEFPELPSRGEYEAVAALLGELLAPPSASVDPVTHR